MIGALIKEQRQKIRYTQKMLADKVSVSPQVISNWERGYTEPSADDISRLSEALECSSDYLLGITNKPNHKMGDHIFKAGMVIKYYTYTWTLKEDMTWDEIAQNYNGFPKNMDDYDISFKVEEDIDTGEKFKTVYINPKTKGEKDIAKRLKQFEAELESSDGLAFDGEPMSDEAKESLLESMELLFRQTQRINKKFTPKKFREDE